MARERVETLEKVKMGRPTENPRTEQYRIRLTKEEVELLAECSEKSGKSKADVLRAGLDLFYKTL